MSEKEYTVGVYHHPDKAGKRNEWGAEIKWYSSEWSGFVGAIVVKAPNATEAKKKAIRLFQGIKKV